MKKNVLNVQKNSEPAVRVDAEGMSPKQVALALGVSEASLKRWCDRGLLDSTRTAGGHRRIERSSVMKFLREREQPAVRPELLGLPTATGMGTLTLKRVLEQAESALESGNEEQLRLAVFNLYLARKDACEICDEVLAPAFHNIGYSWEHGKIEIYQERRACEICMRLLREFRTRLPALSVIAPRAIGGSLANDPYMLAPAMAELVLREAGWAAENFGVDIPAETFCIAIKKHKPRLVWISVGHIADEGAFIESNAKLFAATREHGAALALGGRGLSPELRKRVKYNTYSESFRDLAAFAAALK